jgi:hypothetical protein
MKLKHTNAVRCLLCEQKLKEVDPELKEWFPLIKREFPDCHISWGFRDEETQNLFFEEGKTKAKWPSSKHNVMNGGKPWAQAIDLFRLRSDGVAEFSKEWYSQIYLFLEKMQAPIDNGGNWKRFKDYPHFELVTQPKQKKASS